MKASSSGLRADRPAVSIVVPFLGSAEQLEALDRTLGSVAAKAGDELIVADNSADGVTGAHLEVIRVVPAPDHHSSYYARNVGAEAAGNDWILFLDADCTPRSEILDEYFAVSHDEGVGAVAGEIYSSGRSLLSRYASSRGMLNQGANLKHPHRPAAVTANLLVRAQAWRSVGGFFERVRSGGDTDFSWRLQERGWRIAYSAAASAEHAHRENLRDLSRQVARHAAGAAWLNRRYPGSMRRPPLLAGLARAVAGVVVWSVTGRLERARFKAIDGLIVAATNAGYLMGNASRTKSEFGVGGLTVLCDSYPHLSETFVVNEARALARLGREVRIEALTRPDRPLRGGSRVVRVDYREDDGLLDRLLAGASLAARHPVRCLRDARNQPGWREGGDHVTRLPSLALVARRIVRGNDVHLHAHFASSAALEAMRLSRLEGRTFSCTAHAFEIFSRPANLVEKLVGATFVTTVSQYGARYLKDLIGPRLRDVFVVSMGIDGRVLERTRPHPNERIVGSVGRLVEKKGFADLIAAVAILERSGQSVGRLEIAGEGPLREDLARLIAELGLETRVRLIGALEPDRVREFLEELDLFVMPCVVAKNGDRDSMPVAIREAMAMEVPVVGTHEVGLPETISDGWGRLVPPQDPERLAEAIHELLGITASQRRAMGTAGREFVLTHCDVDIEARKLAALIWHDP